MSSNRGRNTQTLQLGGFCSVNAGSPPDGFPASSLGSETRNRTSRLVSLSFESKLSRPTVCVRDGSRASGGRWTHGFVRPGDRLPRFRRRAACLGSRTPGHLRYHRICGIVRVHHRGLLVPVSRLGLCLPLPRRHPDPGVVPRIRPRSEPEGSEVDRRMEPLGHFRAGGGRSHRRALHSVPGHVNDGGRSAGSPFLVGNFLLCHPHPRASALCDRASPDARCGGVRHRRGPGRSVQQAPRPTTSSHVEAGMTSSVPAWTNGARY